MGDNLRTVLAWGAKIGLSRYDTLFPSRNPDFVVS